MEFKLKTELTAGDVFSIMFCKGYETTSEGAKFSEDAMLKIISVCIAEPKMTPEDVAKMPAKDIISLIEPCMRLYASSFLSSDDKKK